MSLAKHGVCVRSGITSVGAVMLLVGGCGGDAAGGAPPVPPPNTPLLAAVVDRSVPLGSGVIAPYRLLLSPSEDRLYVATGRGEFFSEGYLHVLDPLTLTEIRTPLEIGLNAADMTWLGDRIAIVLRTAKTLVVVDPQAWSIVDSLRLDFAPIAVAALGPDRVAVASIDTNDVVAVRLAGGRLQLDQRGLAPDFLSDLVAAPESGRLYAITAKSGIAIMDAATLRVEDRVALPNEVGKQAQLWKRYLVIPDREGYVHFMDTATTAVESLDLAPFLGLDRSNLPARAIDTNDIEIIDEDRLAVINNRAFSVIVDDRTGTGPATPVARMVGAAFGVFSASQRAVLSTLPDRSVILRVPMPTSVSNGATLPATRTRVGVEVVAAVPARDRAQSVFALTSDERLHVVSSGGSTDATWLPAGSDQWTGPVAAIPGGGAAVTRSSAPRLILMDASGMAQSYAQVPGNPFSLTMGTSELVVTSRLDGALAFVDPASGGSTILGLARARPRVAAQVMGDTWLVAHDTTPDIGISVVAGGRELAFDPADDWYADLVRWKDNAVLGATFAGQVAILDSSGRPGRRKNLGIVGATAVGLGRGTEAWVVSQSLGSAYRIDLESLTATGRVAVPAVKQVFAVPDTSQTAIVTTRRVDIVHF